MPVNEDQVPAKGPRHLGGHYPCHEEYRLMRWQWWNQKLGRLHFCTFFLKKQFDYIEYLDRAAVKGRHSMNIGSSTVLFGSCPIEKTCPKQMTTGPLHVDTYHVGPMQVDHQPFAMIRDAWRRAAVRLAMMTGSRDCCE